MGFDLDSSSDCSDPSSGESFELDWRDVAERAVQAAVVEPADVFHDRELELGLGAHTRSVISSVLQLSRKLSATGLS